MDNKIVIILLATFCLYVSCARHSKDPKRGKVVVCYLKPVELYGEPMFKLDVPELSLCTHLVFENAWIDTKNYTIAVDPLMHIGGDRDEHITSDFISALKKNHPRLKVTLAVTMRYGDDELTEPSLPRERKQMEFLIRSASKRMREFGMDGLDLFFWNLPETSEGVDSIITFVQELKEEFLPYDYIVTATFLVFSKLVSFTNELVKLNRFLDLIHITTVDVVLSRRRLDYVIVPLKGKNESDSSNLEFIIKHLLTHGVKPSKLVLVSFLYGYAYLLTDPDDEEDIQVEDFTAINAKRLYVYKDMCSNLTKGEEEWVYRWFPDFSMPYVREGSRLIFFEDPKSIVSKTKVAIDYDLKGVAIWGLQWDDYKGQCDVPNDTYSDFFVNYRKFRRDPNLHEILKDIDLPNVTAATDFGGKSYGVINNELCFQTPELKTGPYPVLRTIDKTISVAFEEKKILNALKSKKKPERPFCIFWPQCAKPLRPRKPATNSSDKT